MMDLVYWAGRLYARAGYLSDASREFTKTPEGANPLWRARLLYGADLVGVEQDMLSKGDPEKKVVLLTELGDFVWRTGEPRKVQVRFESALQIAEQVVNRV